ncbi:type VII secretion protein EccB [Streptomyces sp. NPDC048057]|uniref:type VII secretion protein EccB n=1 Tax=Streptomyces sp. NPDC048057 TaxID=3155628 RepID=UPI0033F59C41
MASRRDELNAYTFAKRRLVAQFLQPNATGSEEGAPRPLRAVVPGAIIGVVILAGFGAWGMFKPVAPKGWDKPGENVIVASKSTTRYVVLETDGEKQLHPVLNMASAKLLLNLDRGKVINVSESVLDSGKIPHGVTVGIPYAPDRLPKAKDAGTAKRWAVCERPGEGRGATTQKAAFVLADREKGLVDNGNRLAGGELLYVEAEGAEYVVDANGTKYALKKGDDLVRQLVVGQGRTPQKVSEEWLLTLHDGQEIGMPEIDGTPGTGADVPGLESGLAKVGMILQATDGTKEQQYVVLKDRVAPISDFMAKLLINSKPLKDLDQNGQARKVSASEFQAGAPFGNDRKWPQSAPVAVNEAGAGDSKRNAVCSVLRDVDEDKGTTTLSTWAGTDFPAQLPIGSSSAYVTPGSGLLFRQFQGEATNVGLLFLVTDTGLRYAMQSNSDSASADSGAGSDEEKKKQLESQTELAQRQLGYKSVDPVPVPKAWTEFLPRGPRLSTGDANQPQGS